MAQRCSGPIYFGILMDKLMWLYSLIHFTKLHLVELHVGYTLSTPRVARGSVVSLTANGPNFHTCSPTASSTTRLCMGMCVCVVSTKQPLMCTCRGESSL